MSIWACSSLIKNSTKISGLGRDKPQRTLRCVMASAPQKKSNYDPPHLCSRSIQPTYPAWQSYSIDHWLVVLEESIVLAGAGSFSSSITHPYRKGCPNTSYALILSLGSAFSILLRRSIATGSTSRQRLLFRSNFSLLLFQYSSSNFLPQKRGRRTKRMWKMAPAEKTSQTGLTLCPLTKVVISGATQPGVPQRQSMQSSALAKADSPKSTITGSSESSLLSMMFSGLRSRCIIPLACRSAIPRAKPLMNCLISSCENRPYLRLIRLCICPADRSSKTIQIELSDSQTAQRRMTWEERTARMMLISLRIVRRWVGLLERRVFCLEKAFTAKCSPSVSRYTSQTVAKPPLPNFFTGLKNRWKPSWFIRPPISFSQSSALSSPITVSSTEAVPSFSSLNPMALPSSPSLMAQNLSQNSKGAQQ